MADHRAIANVGATLRNLLADRMAAPVPVTLAPPGVAVAAAPGRRVNLFLYRVEESAALRNQEAPPDPAGRRGERAPLSLVLRYLLSAHGDAEDDEATAHEILGDAMAVLHDHPVVTPEFLRARDAPPRRPVLAPGLLEEVERVRITHDPLPMEEISKVWTSLDAPYRLSVSYSVSVVQIRSRRPPRPPRFVGEPPAAGPRVHVVPGGLPRIASVAVVRAGETEERPFPVARVGDLLVLRGTSLAAERMAVALGGVDATSGVATQEEDRLVVRVPDEPPLLPGPHPIGVVRRVPGLPQAGFPSNRAVFLLVPRVDAVRYDAGTNLVEARGARLYDRNLDTVAYVGSAVVPSSGFTVATPERLVFPLPDGVSPGSHPLRVRVNGAESLDDRLVSGVP